MSRHYDKILMAVIITIIAVIAISSIDIDVTFNKVKSIEDKKMNILEELDLPSEPFMNLSLEMLQGMKIHYYLER